MGSTSESPVKVDALVVGAGMAGIYTTYRLSRAGFNVKCIEAAEDIGGTWYWNKYPGAMSDTETYLYRFSWDKEDLQSYPWDRRYIYQPEILKYLHHIVERHDLRKYMRFNTEMKSASWDDGLWKVSCEGGLVFHAQYLVTCLGILSTPNYPDIPGIASFKGETVHTAKWDEHLNLAGKTVGIIGNGSTGIQVMTAIAPEVKKLISFQRRPQYSVPSGQGKIEPGYRENINSNYDKIYEGVFNSQVGFGFLEPDRKTMQATPEERREAFQNAWDQGNGLRFMFGIFGDIITDREANEEACKFIRSKIDEIVKDPRKANALKPRDMYARRPLCDSGYFEIFNRENIDIVDLRETSIHQVVPEGIQMIDGTIHKLDVLILATGFDAVEGNYLRASINGREDKSIQKHWENGAKAYGGIACSGFPNMFLVSGPQGAFANYPPVIEMEIELIMNCILHAKQGQRIMEVTPAAEQKWNDICEEAVEETLFRETDSWFFGTNVKGRSWHPKLYFGGIKKYLDWSRKEIDTGFPGFNIDNRSKI